MRILSITAGAAAMYCGSCLRDNALAAELVLSSAGVATVRRCATAGVVLGDIESVVETGRDGDGVRGFVKSGVHAVQIVQCVHVVLHRGDVGTDRQVGGAGGVQIDGGRR